MSPSECVSEMTFTPSELAAARSHASQSADDRQLGKKWFSPSIASLSPCMLSFIRSTTSSDTARTAMLTGPTIRCASSSTTTNCGLDATLSAPMPPRPWPSSAPASSAPPTMASGQTTESSSSDSRCSDRIHEIYRQSGPDVEGRKRRGYHHASRRDETENMTQIC